MTLQRPDHNAGSAHRAEERRVPDRLQCALVRPLDIFDLVMHAAPLLLVALKLWRQWRAPGPSCAPGTHGPRVQAKGRQPERHEKAAFDD